MPPLLSMASIQHITLEEFTSSTSPLPTILLPRSQAIRLLELCELAEMTPTANFLDFIGNASGESSATAPTSNVIASKNPHVLVTQMALLLYLGEYNHARHLWRRHRRTPPSSPAENSSNTTDTTDESNNGNATNDYAQLECLWNASKYCYLWSTGGIHSLTCNNGDGMQVEEEPNDESNNDSGNLPFSTLALRALQVCQSSRMEPLSTYSRELFGVVRSRINRQLHTSFDKLDSSEFLLRMNLTSSEEVTWSEFGWRKEGGHLVSNADVVLEDEDDDDCIEGAQEENRVDTLTDIVMFLEGKVNA